MTDLPDFETPKLATAVEALTPDQIDSLPFGVIRLDRDGNAKFYSKKESQLSGMGNRPVVGRSFFADVAPCMNNSYFKGRIDKAIAAGRLDVSFQFVGDFSDRNRQINVRVQSASSGGDYFMFFQRAAA